MPNMIILDTETISLNKPFIYDIGYIIVNENFQVLLKRHFIIKQVYDNKELFATAYYKEKKPKYTTLLRTKKAEKVYLGIATQTMKRDMKKYSVNDIYAYNCRFDKGAFEFTTDFYKVKNTTETKNFIDIMKLAKVIHDRLDYLEFTTNNDMLTKTNKPKRTAETTYSFIINEPNYKEIHISISDCEIELEILKKVVNNT